MPETKESIGKPFLTYEQLIALLKTEKGLDIPDYSYAENLLKKHSYYGLISGYKRPFKGKDKRYKINTAIDDIYALYCFDEQLRSFLFRYILIIEKHIKSLISYSFCETYGEQSGAYLDATKYNYVTQNQVGINKLISKLAEIINQPNEYQYILYQKLNYGNVPLWVMMKALTLGNVSKMYSFLRQSIQVKVSKEFDSITECELEGMLDILSRFRNVCAHNERLFDYKYRKRKIVDTYVHEQLGIRGSNYGKSDIFAIIISFRYLLSDTEYRAMLDELEWIMETLLKTTRQIQKLQIEKLMGFPPNWKDIREVQRSKVE